MLLPISLTAAAALALLHIWLAVRCSQVRRAAKISIGDGGSDPMTRRMRAHSNFAENAPLFLILLALLELAGSWPLALWIAVLVFVLARLCHAFGMDKGVVNPLRMAGIAGTWIVLIGLAGWAVALTYMDAGSGPIRFESPAVKG
jgi:uncharacterized membrane protein YecN with MAPEG domain